MRGFLLVWNPGQSFVLQQDLLDHLDSRPEIKNYYVPFAGCVLLVADHTQDPSKLSHLVHNRFPSMLLIVTPADQWALNGWMPQPFWDLIQHPKSSGRWDKPSLSETLESLSKLKFPPPPKK